MSTNTSAYLPIGSTVTTNEDGSINIVPPSGWQYVGFDNDGGYQEEAIGGGVCLSCTCNSGGGSCMPAIIGQTAGCVAYGGCTNCTIAVSGIISGTQYGSGGFLNTSANAEIINLTDDMPASFKAMYSSVLVQSTITDYINSVYGGSSPPSTSVVDGVITAPDGYALAFVNILGRAVMIPVPTTDFDEAIDAGGSSISCSCSEGSCTLYQDPPPLGTFCDGVCTGTCSMCSSDLGVVTYTATGYLY